MTLRSLAALLAALLAASAAEAASFRPNATVAGDTVTVGDLFDGAGGVSDRVVARAPVPGQRMVFDARALATLAQTYGIDWRPATPHDRVIVQRSATVIGGGKIESLVRDFLADKNVVQPFAIVFDRQSIRAVLPTDAGAPALRNMSWDQTQQRFSGMLVADAANGEIAMPVSGRIAPVVEVPVLNRALEPGEVIGAGDIDMVPMQKDRVARDAVTDPDKIIGQAAGRLLSPQRPLRANDLARDLVVKRGQTVVIAFEDDTMSLTTEGRALTDGAKGEPVKVVNIASSRIVEGTAAAPGLVTVSDDTQPNIPGAQAPATQQDHSR